MSHPPEPNGENRDDVTVEHIRSALHDAAQAYQPSRTAIVNRVASGRAATRSEAKRLTFFSIRPVGAALAVAVTLVLSVVAVRSMNTDGPNNAAVNPPAAAPVAASASPAPATARPGATSTKQPRESATPPPASGQTSSSGQPAGSDFLVCDGAVDPHSVATWSQNNVTVTNTKAIDSLRITIKVALTAGTADAGRWTTVPNSDITITVTRQATALTYAYALKPGTTLAPGKYTFAAQFQHHSGRSADQDSYTVTARTGSAGADLGGAFG
ncbi:MAG TPA: hypothetical protein VGP57_08705 [Actinoplanes sp.]|jgi:hypothetical protein|nr:hypothetical protein [Actinoplanes sp.]